MKTRMHRIAAACMGFAVVGSSCALAQSATASGRLYRLTRASTYQKGCFEPCLCPILIANGIGGTFRLKQVSSDPLFDNYEVNNVNWTIDFGPNDWTITGRGTYRRGGEFALTHQMVLDLSTNGEPLEHFDSGIVVGSSEFPRIDITISINGMFCFDTAIRVVAVPVRRADFNADGAVNSADLASMLGEWGTGGGCDINEDGLVGAADLSLLLGEWGEYE